MYRNYNPNVDSYLRRRFNPFIRVHKIKTYLHIKHSTRYPADIADFEMINRRSRNGKTEIRIVRKYWISHVTPAYACIASSKIREIYHPRRWRERKFPPLSPPPDVPIIGVIRFVADFRTVRSGTCEIRARVQPDPGLDFDSSVTHGRSTGHVWIFRF